MGKNETHENNHYISEITRNEIIDVIENGVNFIGFSGLPDRVFMPVYGKLTELRFLERLYNLKEMPSSDRRFANAEGDIIKHTINNDDWNNNWVFSDSRFGLNNGSADDYILRFICEMIHPAVRINDDSWKHYLESFNKILSNDGYELYPKMSVSGKEVYSYKRIDSIVVADPIARHNAELKFIGDGSYANVFIYHDPFYDIDVVVKRALPNLSEKEMARFEQEFRILKKLDSPHIVKVYSISKEPLQYSMERLDLALEDYILRRSSLPDIAVRKGITYQMLDCLEYIHNNDLLHRDLSPRNLMLKKFDDGSVLVKITDFGLVKIPESDLTSENSKVKGSFNDPELKLSGFAHYSFEHEIYAVTLMVMFIMTGFKENFKGRIKDPMLLTILNKGTNSDIRQRYKTLSELKADIDRLVG